MITQRPYIFLTKITTLALIMSALPLPALLADLSPFWMLLFYIYWLNAFESKSPIFLALMLGLLMDILQGNVMGQNGLAMVLSTLFMHNIKQSFCVSNLSTQQIYIFVASMIYLVSMLLVHILIQGFHFSGYLLITPATMVLFWPVVEWWLSHLKH